MKHPKYPEFMPVASAPIFVISAPNLQIVGGPQVLTLGRLSFQELGGINSEINVEQYVSVDSTGTVNHSKQMGLTKPPTVTLKRGVDTNLALWYWHNMALMGLPTARTNVSWRCTAAASRRSGKPSRSSSTRCCPPGAPGSTSPARGQARDS